MNAALRISISRELLDAILEGAKRLYPKETILLLRGRKNKDSIDVNDLLVPPLAHYGRGFANIPLHMLPMDFSVVGTVHSHPSGSLTPSHADLNHFFGVILMIAAFPFRDEQDVSVYNCSGEKLPLHVVEHQGRREEKT